MGMATVFFFGATIIFLIFQARKEKNGAKPTTSLRLHVTTRTTSQDKARQGTRYDTVRGRNEPEEPDGEGEGGGTEGPDQTRKASSGKREWNQTKP